MPRFVTSGLRWLTGAALSGSATVPCNTLPSGHSGIFGDQPSKTLHLKQNPQEHRGWHTDGDRCRLQWHPQITEDRQWSRQSQTSVCVFACVCVCRTILPAEEEKGASNPSYETRQGETVCLKILPAPSDSRVVFLFFCPRTFSCVWLSWVWQ